MHVLHDYDGSKCLTLPSANEKEEDVLKKKNIKLKLNILLRKKR